jgi:hypothetical protein
LTPTYQSANHASILNQSCNWHQHVGSGAAYSAARADYSSNQWPHKQK